MAIEEIENEEKNQDKKIDFTPFLYDPGIVPVENQGVVLEVNSFTTVYGHS